MFSSSGQAGVGGYLPPPVPEGSLFLELLVIHYYFMSESSRWELPVETNQFKHRHLTALGLPPWLLAGAVQETSINNCNPSTHPQVGEGFHGCEEHSS